MPINIGKEEFELNELISQTEFGIVKLNAVIAGLQEAKGKKVEALGWLVPLREEKSTD